MKRTDWTHPLEAARVAAMDAAGQAENAKGTIVFVQIAEDGSVDWMIEDARTALRHAKERVEAAERLLAQFKKMAA
jgi:hypothetical protein